MCVFLENREFEFETARKGKTNCVIFNQREKRERGAAAAEVFSYPNHRLGSTHTGSSTLRVRKQIVRQTSKQ